MPNNYILKDFDGGAQKTTLTAALTSSATSFSVVDGSSFPPGSSPFVVVIDRGLATEEKILITSRVGNSFNVLERAYDGSSAQTHALGSVVEHALDAYTVEQANRYVNLQTVKGDLVAFDGTTSQKLAVGANNTVLVADSAQSSGIKWGQVEADSISAAAITAIATQVESLISPSGVPAGVITQFAGASAPTGWLLCQGQSVSTTTYASLFAAIGYTYGGSGSSFIIPNLQGRVPVGLDGSQGEFLQLAQTGGSKTHPLTVSEMPSHGHSGTTGQAGSHRHQTRDFPNYQFQLASGSTAYSRLGEDSYTEYAGDHQHSFTTNNAGSGSPHQNLQPYIVVNYIIKA
jgi:microcystin-dependent protein